MNRFSYLSRLNDYCPRLSHGFKKWKICEVILVVLNAEF